MTRVSKIAEVAPREHRLARLLAPRSIAVVGASERPGSAGHALLTQSPDCGYRGRLYAVNPKRDRVGELPCYGSVQALPDTPDLCVLAVADERLEAALRDVIEAGAGGAVIFGGVNLANDRPPGLAARLAAMAKQAGLPVCGGNGMGFYNVDTGVRASFIRPPYDTRPGPITLISHSGSSWSSLTLNDRRLGFNLTISGGQEFTVTAADYLDYALTLPTTRAVGLILETVRDPDGFVAALQRTVEQRVPVVVMKVGRTARSVAMAQTHSGAIAGDDAAYQAIFSRFGVQRVETLEEMAATLSLFTHAAPLGRGSLVTIHDSGYEREMLTDLAGDTGTPLADIGEATASKLASLLDPGLEPVNPLDAWGSGRDYARVFTECFCALMNDEEAAIGFVAHSPRDHHPLSNAWTDTLIEAARRQHKPVAMLTSFPLTRHGEITRRLTDAGIPVLEGMKVGLQAAANVICWRDFHGTRREYRAVSTAPEVRTRWRKRLQQPTPFSEAEALMLLRDYGLGVCRHESADTRDDAVAAARRLKPPFAVKTAMNIQHKTEHRGVLLNVAAGEIGAAYDELQRTLGPRVLIAEMAPAGVEMGPAGVEMALGIVRDAQFGALIMIAAGGTLIELLRDCCLLLPPFDEETAMNAIARLSIASVLQGHRGRPAYDTRAFARAAASLSTMAAELGDLLAEVDVNPIIVAADGAVAVDALVVAAS